MKTCYCCGKKTYFPIKYYNRNLCPACKINVKQIKKEINICLLKDTKTTQDAIL